MADVEPVTTTVLQSWGYAAPYICAALCAWYVRRSQVRAIGRLDTTAAVTQLKVGEESEDIQARIRTLQDQLHLLQDKMPEMIRKEIAPPIVALHARLDRFEASVKSSLTAAGLKWDQEYTVVPGNKPKDIK